MASVIPAALSAIGQGVVAAAPAVIGQALGAVASNAFQRSGPQPPPVTQALSPQANTLINELARRSIQRLRTADDLAGSTVGQAFGVARERVTEAADEAQRRLQDILNARGVLRSGLLAENAREIEERRLQSLRDLAAQAAQARLNVGSQIQREALSALPAIALPGQLAFQQAQQQFARRRGEFEAFRPAISTGLEAIVGGFESGLSEFLRRRRLSSIRGGAPIHSGGGTVRFTF
ncbi:MAG TPA: hypothetical protein VF226_04795 [Hyphomicrobiaceae bacterium]